MIKETLVPGQFNRYLTLESLTIINIIYDTTEASEYTRTITIDINVTTHQFFLEFLDQIWNPFIKVAKEYQKGFNNINITIRQVSDIS